MMKAFCLAFFFLIFPMILAAQEHNSVPLDNAAYGLIELGIMHGIIVPPHSVKPWDENTVKEELQEMIYNHNGIFSANEINIINDVLDSFNRTPGLDLFNGRIRAEKDKGTVEAGLGWESFFSVSAPKGYITSINAAKIYSGGNIFNFSSWKISALMEFLYIGREKLGYLYAPGFAIPSLPPYVYSKQWDGGLLSLRRPRLYSGWPDDPSLALAFEAELNGVFFNNILLQLSLGRIRRDWGPGGNGSSLFINSHSRPFTALEVIITPLRWMDISFLAGMLEHFREDASWPKQGIINNMLNAVRFEFNPIKYIYFDIGTSLIPFKQVNWAFFANLELRLPGILKLWGSIFTDNLDFSYSNPLSLDVNSFAYQAGIKASISWLPFTSFVMRYTKVEPYCYAGFSNSAASAYINGGESLGFYMPPNSDEFLLGLESVILPNLKIWLQYQLTRHGADFGYLPARGSSLYDTFNGTASVKYFLMDAVYQWDNIIKLGCSFSLKTMLKAPPKAPQLSFFAELGFVNTRFSINGTAGAGNEAEYEFFSDSVYCKGNKFIFSIGFKLFP